MEILKKKSYDESVTKKLSNNDVHIKLIIDYAITTGKGK